MARNGSLRHVHRWTSMAFVASIVVTIVALALPDPIEWVAYVPLAPLFVLLATGVHLFVLPYRTRRRAGRAATEG